MTIEMMSYDNPDGSQVGKVRLQMIRPMLNANTPKQKP